MGLPRQTRFGNYRALGRLRHSCSYELRQERMMGTGPVSPVEVLG